MKYNTDIMWANSQSFRKYLKDLDKKRKTKESKDTEDDIDVYVNPDILFEEEEK